MLGPPRWRAAWCWAPGSRSAHWAAACGVAGSRRAPASWPALSRSASGSASGSCSPRGSLGAGRQRHAARRQLGRRRPGQQLLGLDRHGAGRDAVVDFLVLVGRHQAAGILGLDPGRRGRRLDDQRLQPLPPARTSWLCAHHTTRAEARDGGERDHEGQDLAAAAVDPVSSDSRGGGRNGIGFVRDGPRRRIQPHAQPTRWVGRSLDRRRRGAGGCAFSLSHFFDGCDAEDL